jgi:hypothetical protein
MFEFRSSSNRLLMQAAPKAAAGAFDVVVVALPGSLGGKPKERGWGITDSRGVQSPGDPRAGYDRTVSGWRLGSDHPRRWGPPADHVAASTSISWLPGEPSEADARLSRRECVPGPGDRLATSRHGPTLTLAQSDSPASLAALVEKIRVSDCGGNVSAFTRTLLTN